MTGTTSRTLLLLSLLQRRRDWSGADLAERLGVSERTVRRDVDRLREFGYRVRAVKGPHGGYRLDAGAELPPLLFDDEQAVALAVALQSGPATGAGIDEAAERALRTVRQVLPARLRHRVDGLRITAAPDGGAPPVGPSTLVTISAAVRAREVLRFDYAARRRRAEPHHLVTRGGRWYLLGWDLDREDWCVYRVDRIEPRVPNGPRFAPRELPGGDVSAFVSARFKGSEGSDAWPCRGEAVLAVVAAAVAPFVGDGIVEDLGPDRCRLVMGSWSWTALAAAIGRFDADVEAAEPAELRRAFARLARRFAAAAESAPG